MLVVIALILVALAIRLNGMWFGLPYQLEPDEPVIWLNGVGWATTFAPHFSGWLSLYPPLRSWDLAVEYLILNVVTPGAPAQQVYFVTGRYVSALYICLLAAFTYQAGKQLGGAYAGGLAMLFIVLQPFGVQLGRFLKADTMAWMFTMGCIAFSLRAYRAPRSWWKPAAIAFVMMLLAVLAKYNFVLVGVVPLLAVFFRLVRSLRWRIGGLVLFIGLGIGVLWLFDHPGPLEPILSFSYIGLLKSGKETVFAFPSASSIISQWWETLGPINAMIVLLGLPIMWLLRRQLKQNWVGLVLVMVLGLGTFVFMSLFIRARAQDIYLIYLVSALLWGSALSVIALRSKPAALLVGVVLMTPWLVDAVQKGSKLERPDTRALTADYFIEHIPPGTHLAVEFDAVEFERAYGGFPSENIYFVELITSVHDEPVDAYARRGIEYLVADYRNINRGGFFDDVGDDEAFLAQVETLVDIENPQAIGMKGPARYIFRVPSIEQRPAHIFLGDGVIFKGYDLPATQLAPGDTLNLVLYWAALREMEANYTVFAHIINANGELLAQNDGLPGDANHRTYDWWAGYFDWDEWPISIPADAPPGEYRLVIGMYDADTLMRLPAVDADGTPLGDHIELSTLTITP